jgi:glycosyltransferase involved in cell wall biosynthesis
VVVAVDGRSLRASGGPRGIARYVESVLVRVAAANPNDRYEVLTSREANAAARRLAAFYPNLVLRSTPIPGRPLFAAAAVTGRPRLDRLLGRCDVFWAPAIAPLSVSTDVPLVLTVHDLSFEHHPADFSAYERAWHRLARPRRLAHRADRLIAVSETVRRDVLEEWRIDPRKVVAVPSGPGRDRPAGGPATRAVWAPGYLLAVGALEPRKRPDLLVEAHGRARSAGLQAELVLAGEGPLREKLSARGATVLGHVSDEQLEALYRDALAVVCVSREEGFAFTPLEAVARGVPAVVSDLPVFNETLGEGALRVPAGDPDALARALVRIEREGELRRRLVTSGRLAIAGLSWERSAERTRAVLAEAVANRR